jgi:hypothetical protein
VGLGASYGSLDQPDEDYLMCRTWAYWSYFVTDVCWSSYVGRDPCLEDPEEDIKAGKLKLPIASASIDESHWSRENLNVKVLDQPCRTTMTFVATCELMRIGRKIMNFV